MQLKEIKYRGGILTFSVPACWVEEYNATGGAVFYEASPDSGTLRLNVLGFTSSKDFGSADSAIAFLAGVRNGLHVTALPNGSAMASYSQTTVEEGENLRIYYWEVANLCPPGNMRLAVFSYTILESQASDSNMIQQISLIEKLITQTEFSMEWGESGRYLPDL